MLSLRRRDEEGVRVWIRTGIEETCIPSEWRQAHEYTFVRPDDALNLKRRGSAGTTMAKIVQNNEMDYPAVALRYSMT